MLLTNVTYVCRNPEKMQDLSGNEINVLPTFPYDPLSKTAGETARRWQEQRHYNKTQALTIADETLPNDPFKIKIISLEVRSEGGRAYKVIDEKNHLFDLRENQLIEAITLYGIEKGGSVGGEFVWGKNGSQMALILVGGKLYQEQLDALNAKNDFAEKQAAGELITPSQCQAGFIYKRLNRYFFYVGKMKMPGDKKNNHVTIELPRPEEEPGWAQVWNHEKRKYELRVDCIPWADATWSERVTQELKFGGRAYIQQSIKPFTEKLESVTAEVLQAAKDDVFKACDSTEFSKTNAYPEFKLIREFGSVNERWEKAQQEYNTRISDWNKNFKQWVLQNIEWK